MSMKRQTSLGKTFDIEIKKLRGKLIFNSNIDLYIYIYILGTNDNQK